MAHTPLDMNLIKGVLRRATENGGTFSKRSLSKAAGEGRDCVTDILNGRNKNPTIKVLANLAEALGGDVSIFGLTPSRAEPPTEDELYEALRDILPDMPRGAPDKRARYLAAGVARVLRLPSVRQPLEETATARAEGVPPPLTTN